MPMRDVTMWSNFLFRRAAVPRLCILVAIQNDDYMPGEERMGRHFWGQTPEATVMHRPERELPQ